MTDDTGPFPSRPFSTPTDVQPLLDLVIAANGDARRPSQWHVGDVRWQMFRSDTFDPATHIRLWSDDAGLLGFAWRDTGASAFLQLHPRAYEDAALEEAMLTWITAEWSVRGDDGAAHAFKTYALEAV